MLQELIGNIQLSLKNHSLGLAKQNVLVDIPWTMVDGDLNLQRIIFRKNNSLYIVKEGDIQESRWEYLPALNSLVIEVGGKKILMNEIFSDGKALILKRDGGSLNFLSFVNQNELPDLNLLGYLRAIESKTAVIESSINYGNSIDENKKQNDYAWANVLFAIALAIIFFMIIASS